MQTNEYEFFKKIPTELPFDEYSVQILFAFINIKDQRHQITGTQRQLANSVPLSGTGDTVKQG